MSDAEQTPLLPKAAPFGSFTGARRVAVLSLNGKTKWRLDDRHVDAKAAAPTTLQRPQQAREEEAEAEAAAAVVNADDDDAPPHDSILQTMRLLDNVFCVQLTDKRIIEGKLNCFDQQHNLILVDAKEYRPKPKFKAVAAAATTTTTTPQAQVAETKDQEEEEEEPVDPTDPTTRTFCRHLGMTLVPGKHIVKVLRLRTSH